VHPFVEELTPLDPEEACARLAGLPYRLWLDSAASTTRLGRFSFLMADPPLVVRSRGAKVEILDTATGVTRSHDGDALDAVETLVSPFVTPQVPNLPPFQCGAAGYLAYDWGATLERLPSPRYDDLGLDDVVLGLYDWVLAWDHAAGRVWLISSGLPESSADRRAERAKARAAFVGRVVSASDVGRGLSTSAKATVDSPQRDARRRLDPADRRGQKAPPYNPSCEMAPSYPVEGGWWDDELELRSSFTRADYVHAVALVREYVHAGDIFQANLSQRFETALTESPWALYRRLRRLNPAPFAAFMEAPEATILSASPERFFHVDPRGHVETRPIKGTSPRGIGPEHDAALGRALTESAKDRAENLMIVDLMRNDLSRVCVPGTVRVPELFALERYATVHHLVSTVVGDLEPGRTALDLLRASFPGGSITGAPKVRAMEIIAELEPSRRSVYCGSLGYWSLSGELDTSIAIRTAVVRGGRLYFNAGGGIVADSNPEQEYRETLDKARGIIDALRPRS
jgi:para-aminobenzoate synthetase component 1